MDTVRKPGEAVPMLCATCRRGGRPLSRLVGGSSREEAIRFDLDQAGITQRDKEAVELVEQVARLEKL